MADFKNLLVWRKAHALEVNVSNVAARIRDRHHAALKHQLTKTANSIAANIVEGRSQESDREFARFLGYSIHSTRELEHHLLVARDVGAISTAEYETLLDQTVEVRKMLYGLRRKLDGGDD